MLSERLTQYSDLTEQKLGELLNESGQAPILQESMAYSVFSGGKRIRPALCMAASELCGGTPEDALFAACALEMIHTYSLIHDDLPAMDNDDMRRGKPSNHKAFGEANAILAGDGLLSLAFYAISQSHNLDALDAIAKGAFEMVMGQSLDVNSGGDESLLRKLQDYKTGALFRAAVGAGAACAGASASQRETLTHFADSYGMLFQITDDILDFEGVESVLGKSVGKDAEENKTTFVTIYGLEQAKEFAKQYAHEAREAVLQAGGDATFFTELISYTLTRKS